MKELLITEILSKRDMKRLIKIFNTHKEVKRDVPKMEVPLSKVESMETLQPMELVPENPGLSRA